MSQTIFFDDGRRKIDFVFVYSKNDILSAPIKERALSMYLNNVKQLGLNIEEESGTLLQNLVCVKVHAPNSVLDKYTNQFRIELSKNNPFYKYPQHVPLKWLGSVVTIPNVNDPLYQRAPATLSGDQPTDYTYAERIYIVYKILSVIKYDDNAPEVGCDWLVTRNIFKAAYSLHDSSDKWTTEGPLSDRQLLARFWGSFRYFYIEQPLNLIERYFGPEVAFYFAWLGFYVRMLIPAASLGLLCLIGGIILYLYDGSYIQKEVCESPLVLCPPCPSNEWCSFPTLKSHCKMMKIAYLMVENPVTVTYSVLMSLWGVLFMVLWKRKQAMLKLRWNLNDIITKSDIRPNFQRAATIQRVSSVTGNIEYDFTKGQKFCRTLFSYTVMLLMLSCYLGAVILVVYYRLNLTYYNMRTRSKTVKEGVGWFDSVTSALLTCVIMMFFDSFKATVCKKMTEIENPRTKAQYDHLYTIKITILSFGNTFFPVVYLAFFKGHFYTHPGDPTQWTFSGIFKADVCKMHGCLMDLSVQLVTIMLIKNVLRMLTEFTVPFIEVFRSHFKYFRRAGVGRCTRWEEDFMLVKARPGLLYGEYIQMVLQYGFMTFFVVSLPIAPILALINNIFELRLDAIRILKSYRRIVPRKVTGIEEWNVVMQIVTVLGTISNPLLIAFGSNLIPRNIYMYRHNNDITGFINSTLSEFEVKQYAGNQQRAMEPDICFYPAKRYPPSHPEKYQLTMDYWYQFVVKAVFFIVLENLCLLLSLFLGYLIPEVPRKIALKLEHDQEILQEARLKRFKNQP